MPASEPIGLQCPGCGQPPKFVLDDGRQCVCGNEVDCHVLFWNAHKSVEELAADPQTIRSPFTDT